MQQQWQTSNLTLHIFGEGAVQQQWQPLIWRFRLDFQPHMSGKIPIGFSDYGWVSNHTLPENSSTCWHLDFPTPVGI